MYTVMEHTLHLLGKIIKTHGYNGTLVLISDKLFDDELDRLKEMFVVIDGLPVPFPVEKLVLLTDTSLHLKLEFVDNQNEAIKLIGCEVYTDIPSHKQEADTELEQLIGFTVKDSKYGIVGIIQKIEDYKGNIVIHVMDGEKETLISMSPELVTSIDNVVKILHITAPEGYF